MKRKLHRLKKWLSKKREYRYSIVSELPEVLKIKNIYIEANLDYPWQVVMICPCGCKSLLHMNLIDDYDPYWKYFIDKKNRITLHPSIHRQIGCKSHFFIRNGNIVWCKN